jgi:ATP-dependent helicase/nuclease subunit B
MYLNSFAQMQDWHGQIVVPDSACMAVINAALDYHSRLLGGNAWRPTQIVTWGNALRQSFEFERLAHATAPAVDFVLSRDQELAVWQAVIADDRELDVRYPGQAALLASEAWRLVHLWDLHRSDTSPYEGADVAAFNRWANAYERRTADLAVTDLARLAAHNDYLPAGGGHFMAQGFVQPPPRLADWLQRRAQVRSEGERGQLEVFAAYAFRDAEQELHAALNWAAAQAAASPQARIAVVLDGIGAQDSLLRRCCADVFGLASDGSMGCFITGGESLRLDPGIRLALRVLELLPLARWDALSEVIRHPLLRGADREAGARAVFDAELRALERYELPLPLVVRLLGGKSECAQLEQVVSGLLSCHDGLSARQSMVGWLQHFDACLKVAGWPDEQAQGADQTRFMNAWGTVCDRLNSLDAVLAPITRTEALAQLRRLLTDATSPALAPTTGVFVVTALEAMVIEPTHVWLLGCASDAWVGAERRSPLLALKQQRDAAMPGTDPARSLWQARVVLETLAAQGGAHCASYARGDGELQYSPSPLIPALARATVAEPEIYLPGHWRQPPARFEFLEDSHGPGLAPGIDLKGGVSVLAAQSACAFRAFARYRLSASDVFEPQPGISARRKGITVHRVLAGLWQELRDCETLVALTPEQRQQRVRAAIQRDLNPFPYETAVERELFFIERERLFVLLSRWLEFELERGPFTVLACEHQVDVDFAGLQFNTRIDRVDELPDGSTVIVDYKTGQCSMVDWEAPRMAEPQLPIYALTAPFDDVSGIAFAAVDRARPRWLQLGHEASGDPADWPALTASWRADLTELANAHQAGYAQPDPRRGADTCRYCEQALFCRRVELDRAPDQEPTAQGPRDE